MLENIPKREYPKLFYRYVKEFLEVLARKTSLKLYLARNYPSFYELKLKEGETLKWKGERVKIPKILYLLPKFWILEVPIILSGKYSIPECHVKSKDVVFDVGAHLGFFSYYAIEKGAGKVYTFEPNPYVFDILKKHAMLWSDKIEPYKLALSDQNGVTYLFVSEEFGGDSTILEERKNSALEFIQYKKRFKVKTMTLDRFIERNSIERVDFIKIDAEGAERKIIRGAEETIREFKPKMAIAAYHFADDKEKIPELVLSIREDYKFKFVDKGEPVLFFF